MGLRVEQGAFLTMATARRTVTRYPSRTMIFWQGTWAEDAPEYPLPPTRTLSVSLRDWVRLYREHIESFERFQAWWSDKRGSLPSEDETGGWREHRCSSCSALLAHVRAATRGDGTITPDLGDGLGRVAFHLETPAAILVPGLTRELDAAGKPRRDAQGRPFFGPPRAGRFRRGRLPSSDGVPRPFIRHANGAVLIHCPGCGRTNELAEPR